MERVLDLYDQNNTQLLNFRVNGGIHPAHALYCSSVIVPLVVDVFKIDNYKHWFSF